MRSCKEESVPHRRICTYAPLSIEKLKELSPGRICIANTDIGFIPVLVASVEKTPRDKVRVIIDAEPPHRYYMFHAELEIPAERIGEHLLSENWWQRFKRGFKHCTIID